MALRQESIAERIGRGTRYLLSTRNEDFGIPAVSPGDPSGCWTTAEAIESILRSPFVDPQTLAETRTLVKFLLQSQLTTRAQAGGWPLVAGGKQASTMATAHSVLSLKLALPHVDLEARPAVAEAMSLGLQWLRRTQDAATGGWGLEPSAGKSGAEPRTVSTFLAVRAIVSDGGAVGSSQSLRRAINFLWSLYDGNGFAPASGRAVDPCSTARAFWAITEAKAENERPEFTKRTVAYVLGARPPGALWELDTEAYVPDGTSGQIVFNNNTTAELLEFLVQTSSDLPAQEDLVRWFQDNQNDNGSWFLGANANLRSEVANWSTNEAIGALSNYLRSIATRPLVVPVERDTLDAASGNRRVTSVAHTFLISVLAVISVVEFILLVGLRSYFERSWNSLPKDFKTTFWWATMVALLVNLVAIFVVWIVRTVLRRSRESKNSIEGEL